MGDLKPLSFSVGIKDNTKKKLEEIERRFNALKDKTITINVAGGSDEELAENLTAATEAFKELKNAVGTGKPLNTIAKKAAKAQEAIDKLSTSLKTLGSTITGNEELNQFISGLGNIIRAVNADLRELKSPGAFKGFAKEAKDAAASANKAEIEIAKLTALQNRMRDTVTSAQKVSLDTTDLERASVQAGLPRQSTWVVPMCRLVLRAQSRICPICRRRPVRLNGWRQKPDVPMSS